MGIRLSERLARAGGTVKRNKDLMEFIPRYSGADFSAVICFPWGSLRAILLVSDVFKFAAVAGIIVAFAVLPLLDCLAGRKHLKCQYTSGQCTVLICGTLKSGVTFWPLPAEWWGYTKYQAKLLNPPEK
jgi:hypothetical protein